MARPPKALPTWFADILLATYKTITDYATGEVKDTEKTRAHVVSVALHLQDQITDRELGGAIGRYANFATVDGPQGAMRFVEQVMRAMMSDADSGRYTKESLP